MDHAWCLLVPVNALKCGELQNDQVSERAHWSMSFKTSIRVSEGIKHFHYFLRILETEARKR